MFLHRGDHNVALGRDKFLRGQEFERVPSRDQIRSLENDAFRVSFSFFLLFIRHVIPTNFPSLPICFMYIYIHDALRTMHKISMGAGLLT